MVLEKRPFHRLRVFIWRWREGLFWWQYKPQKEFRTFMVEGKKGEGKTRYLAGYACQQMRRGFRVASNFTIVDLETGERSVPIAGWMDVLRLSVDALETSTPTLFVVDEFQNWADSRAWAKTPPWFKSWMAQSRHYGVGICGSVHRLANVEVRVRQLVDDLVRVRKVKLGRLPVFRREVVTPESVDADAGYALDKAEWRKFKWFGGYSTRELIAVEEWQSDDEIEAEIAELTARARDLVRPGEFATFAGYQRARATDVGRGARSLDLDAPAEWDDLETLNLP